MTVQEVLSNSDVVVSDTEVLALPCTGLAYNSRQVRPGFLFFAIIGAAADGRTFASAAMAAGAIAVVSDAERPATLDMPWIRVAHARQALAAAAKIFLGKPDEQLGVAGITGTNGKTTCLYLIDSVLRASGAVTTRIGTIGYDVAGTIEPAANTTPESLDLFQIFRRTLDAGGKYVTMEVSSHALAQGRVAGVRFHTAVFTNLTQDHLDFHGTMEAYFEAKQLLFSSAFQPRWAIINADDSYAPRIQPPEGTRVVRYGLHATAELRAEQIETTFSGLTFVARFGAERHKVRSPLVGEINVYNILAAIGTGLSYGISWEAILRGIAKCTGIPGRFERVDAGQPFLVAVDYAHTDDALRNTLSVARKLSKGRGRLITLFGCGGDRDRNKRPKMGMAAAELSDIVVLTSDNPRSEGPLEILNDVLVGLRRFDTPHIVEPDRASAIRKAIGQARPGDVVILAGKGHETYQILRDRTIAFDDRVVAREALVAAGYGRAA